MNSDLNGLEEMLPTPKDSESDPINSDHNSPFIDNTRPEKSFEGLWKLDKSTPEAVENIDVPSKPVISEFITPRSTTSKLTEDEYSSSVKTDEKEKYDDPILTPKSDDEVNEKQEKSHFIADEIFRTMLWELDADKGINKALNNGDAVEEMPSFLTRGIQTDIIAIIQYLHELFDKIKVDKETFLDSLSTPLNRDPLEILGHLQDIEENSNDNDSDIPFQQSVLPVELYLENEKQRRINRMTEEERKIELEKAKAKKEAKIKKLEEEGIIYDSEDFDDLDDESIMAEWENIHNKVVFDWVNEILDNYRPYGLKGPPLTWSNNTRTLTYKYSEPERIDEVLFEVQDKVMKWAETEAGTLTDSQTVVNAPQEIRHIMSEKQFLNQVREERLANLLSSEINENEPLWLDYEYEETQVKLDLADMVLQDLLFETINQWSKLENHLETDFNENDAIDRLFSEVRDEKPIILPKDHTPTNVVFKALPLPPNVMNIQGNSS
jgi:Domain of unknown function (DUF4378)